MVKPYEPPDGFSVARLYPADWECAIAELWWNGEAWACVSLKGVDPAAEGKARTRDAEAVVEVYGLSGQPTGEWRFPFQLDEAMDQLRKARVWVFENEEGRTPYEGEELSAAGAAFSTMSEEEQRRWTERLERQGSEPDES